MDAYPQSAEAKDRLIETLAELLFRATHLLPDTEANRVFIEEANEVL